MKLFLDKNKAKFFVILLFLLGPLSAECTASWLIDVESFHTSVHGQVSCQDCHADISEKKDHPDPVNVNRPLSAFFRLDQCLACHEDTIDEIVQEGQHAGQDVTEWQRFDNCIECHNPHYQLSSSTDVPPDLLNQAREKKCSFCHDFQDNLPEMTTEDEACMVCHQQIINNDQAVVRKTKAFCFHCHGAGSAKATQLDAGQVLIHPDEYDATPHAKVPCLTCHPQAAAFGHANQPGGDCGQCHLRHDEKVIHDAHTLVSCEACHLREVTPQKERMSGQILWKRETNPNGSTSVHLFPALIPDESCRRCHFSENPLGAAAMVLPAKSIICMPCHTATFSVGDTTTMLALAFFIMGFLWLGSTWFSGRSRSIRDAGRFSWRLGPIFKAFILEGLFQRRLFRVSRDRWLLHALVFFPFMFRFVWGMVALVGSLWHPESAAIGIMLDKNHPLTAFLFDLSGIVVIAGVFAMIFRRFQGRKANSSPSGLPPADWPAFILLAGILVVGYLLEGMRISMTGSPDGAAWAFMGDLISRFLFEYDLIGIYGYVWYLHAILTGVFVAYLPFSRMLHMVAAPVVLAMNAAVHHQKNGSVKQRKA